jgi:S-adenosylmethionine:tRNA ribosyltransferase-isomerase
MRTDSLDYDLPPELIADAPAGRREDARLLITRRSDPTHIEHRRARDLPDLVEPNDAIIVNDTRVLRARLEGARADTGGRVEGLFLTAESDEPTRWRVMLKASNRLRPDLRIDLAPDAWIELIEQSDSGVWTVRAETPHASPAEALEAIGRVPLPPYILQARKQRGRPVDDPADAERYQTVYAEGRAGSVAAPTAGLHFTPELLDRARARGASVHRLTLDVGAGTFKPVETEELEDHPMHAETIHVPAATLRAVAGARAAGARSLVVGTTSARALESVPESHEGDWIGATDLLISPGYAWKRVDALLTNFHLPRSTLLAMVGAMFPGGVPDLLAIYRTAIAERYRFYSFGDAMLILP